MIQLTDNNVLMKTKENGDKQSYLEAFLKTNNGFLQFINSDYKIFIRFLDIIQNILIFTIILMIFCNEIEKENSKII